MPPPLRILVVEDDADTARTAALLLELYGYKVRLAADGMAALEAARSWQPDVVLLNIGLPGMDGYEVAQRLAVENKPFIIAVTGYGRDVDRWRSEQAGIHLHLVKPVDPELLLSILRKFQGA
jgi:two-component system, chemotaxis family, CheB/CheR fusion protein